MTFAFYSDLKNKDANTIQIPATKMLTIPGITFSCAPCSRLCSLEEQYFKCGIFWGYDTAQRHASNSEAPVLAGGVSVFLRGTQFSGASELKEGLVSKCKFI